MAFLPYEYHRGNPPILYLPAAAAAYTAGQALVFAAGVLTTVAAGVGQDIDEGKHYISMEAKTVANAGDLLGVIKCDEDIIWATKNGAAATALTIGGRYVLDDDALSIIDTTTKGCFVVTYTASDADNAAARGYFSDDYNETA